MDEPIRVLQVIASMNRGGAESMLMNIYRTIDRTKVQFDFLVCTKEKAAYDDEIISLGGRIFHNLERITKNNLLSYQLMCNSFFKEHKYGLVHCHIGSIAQFVTRSARKSGAYTIIHSHSADMEMAYLLLVYPSRFTADCYISCSEKAGINRFGKRIVNSNKYMEINNAVQTEKYLFDAEIQNRIRKELNIENKFVVGHIGRMVYAKNHEFLLDIFNEILKKKPESVLVLAGDGDKREEIVAKAKKLDILNKIKILGTVDNVSELLNAFDVMIFPSRYEGLPVSLIEAQANGLKCLLSDTVSEETKICDCVEFLSLDLSAEQWAEKALNIKDYTHNDYTSEIIEAGYDVNSTAKKLQKFYIDNYKH